VTQELDVLFERVRRTMERKETLLCECQLGKCLCGECDMDECPVDGWIDELKTTIKSMPKEAVRKELRFSML